jgi:hypothetical protein
MATKLSSVHHCTFLAEQSRYDLDRAQDALGIRIKSEVRPLAA